MKKPQIWDPYKDFQKTVLPNGLSIYSAHWDRSWAYVRILVHSGALADPKGKEGLAHFTEHMVSQRAGNLSKKKISRYVKMCGGRVAFGSTDAYQTEFSFKVPLKSNVILKWINIFGKMLLLPFEDKRLEIERSVVLQEFKRSFPTMLKYDVVTMPYQHAYVGTRFDGYIEPLGNPESIQAITMSDIEKFAKKHYNPANMTIIAAGGIDHGEFVAMFNETIFAQAKGGYQNKLVKPLAEIDYPASQEKILIISEFLPGLKTDISSFVSYALIPGTFARKYLLILARILREVIIEDLREKTGSIYAPEVDWEFLGDAYDLHISLILDKEKLDQIKDSIVVNSLKRAGGKKRFNDMKLSIVRSFAIDDMNMEDFCKRSGNDLVKYGKIFTSAEELAAYETLSYEGYCSLVDYLLDAKRWWSLIEIP